MIILKKVNDSKILYNKKWFIKSKKILHFNSSQVLSDNDIMSLFLGLVRIIKRNAEKETEKKYKKSINYLTSRLNKILINEK